MKIVDVLENVVFQVRTFKNDVNVISDASNAVDIAFCSWAWMRFSDVIEDAGPPIVGKIEN